MIRLIQNRDAVHVTNEDAKVLKKYGWEEENYINLTCLVKNNRVLCSAKHRDDERERIGYLNDMDSVGIYKLRTGRWTLDTCLHCTVLTKHWYPMFILDDMPSGLKITVRKQGGYQFEATTTTGSIESDNVAFYVNGPEKGWRYK